MNTHQSLRTKGRGRQRRTSSQFAFGSLVLALLLTLVGPALGSTMQLPSTFLGGGLAEAAGAYSGTAYRDFNADGGIDVRDDGFVFIPLQGRLTERRSFQAASPIDMIAFVELTRDRRGFRFLQETRNGRVLLAESDQADVITQAVADYLARRLIEREKALSAATNPAIQPLHSVGLVSAPGAQQPAPGKPPRARPGFLRYLARGFAFLIEVIGSAVFFGLLAAGVWWLWKTYFH